VRKNIRDNDKLVVVVTEDKKYYPARPIDVEAYGSVPQPEPVPEPVSPNDPRAITPPLYGYTTFGDLFNRRQLYVLQRLVEAIRKTQHRQILVWLITKLADYNSAFTSWHSNRQVVSHTIALKVLTMTWDYVESNPFASGSGTLWGALFDVVEGAAFLRRVAGGKPPIEPIFGSALSLPFGDKSFRYVVTDPPYFDNIPYPEVYDFFYVWLKRAMGDLYPEQFKFYTLWMERTAEEISIGGGRSEAQFRKLFAAAMKEIRRVLADDGKLAMFFAHSRKEAWIFVLEALSGAGLQVLEVIPIKAFAEVDIQGRGKVASISALIIVAQPRLREGVAYVEKLRPQIEDSVKRRVEELWRQGFRGIDLTMAAYAEALKVATSYGEIKSLRGNAVESVIEIADKTAVDAVVNLLYGVSGLDRVTAFYIYAVNNLPVMDGDTFLNLTKLTAPREELKRLGLVVEEKRGSNVVVRVADFYERCDKAGRSQYLVDFAHRVLCAFKEGGKQKAQSVLSTVSTPYALEDICRFLEAAYAKWGAEKDVINSFKVLFCKK
jgi:adenine-specific DNA methylase